jgi:hypothetical protein
MTEFLAGMSGALDRIGPFRIFLLDGSQNRSLIASPGPRDAAEPLTARGSLQVEAVAERVHQPVAAPERLLLAVSPGLRRRQGEDFRAVLRQGLDPAGAARARLLVPMQGQY